MSRNYNLKKEHEGLPKFSFSKLSTYEHCPYSYFLTYIKHIRGRDSIYGVAGTSAHECSQDLVEGKIDNKQAVIRFLEEMDEAINVLGLKFPTEKSGITYKQCVKEFLEQYNPQCKEFDIEKGFDVLIGETKTLVYGFIDLIEHREDGSLDVIDYKTSSDFSKKEFVFKKMQLLVYAKALIEEGYKINRLYFNMLKYCNISWQEINSKKELVDKSTKAERNAVGDKLKAVVKRMLKKEGLDDIEIEMRIANQINNNIIDDLVEDRFTITDYEVDVELSKDSLLEMETWIDQIINNINKNGEDEENYPCVKLDKSSEFFCNMLCGKECKHFELYKNNNGNSYKNRKKKDKEEDEDLDDLI